MELARFVDLLGPWNHGAGPLYRRLTDALLGAIRSGDIAGGTRLPSERLLAQALAVSRSTVVAAYADLEAQAWIERRRGSGTRVRRATRDAIADAHARAATLARNPSFARLVDGERVAVNFTTGAPSGAERVPFRDFVLSERDMRELVDDRGYSPLGLPELREAVAAYFRRRGVPTKAENILITAGSQQAITLTAALYVRAGDAILIESPTYFGAIDAYTSAGARCTPLPMDEHGAQSAGLAELIRATAPRLIYLVPTFQNPTGAVMPEYRRREFARIAATMRVPIVEDETLAALELDTAAPPPIAAFADDGVVLSFGSLSKLVWAGLRIGWLRAPEAVITRLARMKAVADLGTTPITQRIAARMLPEIGRAREQRRSELLPQREALASALRDLLPEWTWTMPRGGFFLWVRLPFGDAQEFAQVALRYGVAITPGASMSVDGTQHDAMRLSYTLDAAAIHDGVERLAEAWQAYRPHARAATAQTYHPLV